MNVRTDEHGVIRWISNNAVLPPQLLETLAIEFDIKAQYAAYMNMARLHTNWWVRMPHASSRPDHQHTMFADMALGRRVLRPAIGEVEETITESS